MFSLKTILLTGFVAYLQLLYSKTNSETCVCTTTMMLTTKTTLQDNTDTSPVTSPATTPATTPTTSRATSSVSTSSVATTLSSVTPAPTTPAPTTPAPTILSAVTNAPTTPAPTTPAPTTLSAVTHAPTTPAPTTPAPTTLSAVTHAPTTPAPTTPAPTTLSAVTHAPTTSVPTTPAPTTPAPTTLSAVTYAPTTSAPTTPVPTTPAPTTPAPTTPVPTTPASTTLVTTASAATSPATFISISPSTSPTTSDPDIRRKKRSFVETGFLGPDGTCICTLPYNTSRKNNTSVPGGTTVLSINDVPVKVPLVVSIPKKFEPSLLDKTSKVFKEYKKEFQTTLEDVYKTVKNFVRVDILGFREGSTECDYAVVLKPGSVIAKSSDVYVDLQNKTSELNHTTILNYNVTSYNSSIETVFQQLYQGNRCYAVDCGKGYNCSDAKGSTVTCAHICTTEKKCQNGGECLHDDRHDVTLCRCKSDSQYVYSGANCQVKSEKFGMSKTNIIATAAGAGAGVVLILVGVIVFLLVRRKRTKTNKYRDDKSDHSKSVSMEELRYDKGNNSRSSDGFLHRPKIHAVENFYHSGLPDTKYVQGREHKIMKDDSGKETYIYPPADYMLSVSRSRNASSYSTYSPDPPASYDLDTNSKFEIQRPNLDPWYLNNY